MKTILTRGSLMLTALIIFAVTLSAQVRHRHHPPRPFQAIEQHKEALEITDEQQVQLDELKTEFKAEMHALRGQELEPEANREAMHSLMESLKTDLDEILTEAQRKQLKALDKAKRAEHKQRFKEARSSVKTYLDQNVQPVMQQQRQKLEADISGEDKVALEQLREAVAQRKAAMQDAKAKGERLERPAKGDRPEREAIKQLVEKYDAEIENLFAEVATQAEQWKADIKFIMEAHRPENVRGAHPQHARKGDRQKLGNNHRAKRGQDKHGKDPIFHKARFLLMDPESPIESTPQALVQAVKVFPNPASEVLNLNYELQEGASVDLQIHSKEGQLQQTLTQGEQKAGTQSARLDISQIRDGAYYLSIVADGTVQILPFVVARR